MARRTTKRRSKLEAKLDAIAAARDGDPFSLASIAVLRDALADDANLVVAAAADAVRDAEIETLALDVVRALRRWLDVLPDAGLDDRGCRAKIALAAALYRGPHNDPELNRRGIRLHQWEGAFGAKHGREDTAAPLRAICALALAGEHAPDVLDELARLLADHHPAARAGAAQAAGNTGLQGAAPMLRLMALRGDDDPAVVAACFDALLRLEPEHAVAFVAEFLAPDSDGPTAEMAALALGESRAPAAFEALHAWSEHHPRVGLLALALLRTASAIDHLLDILANAPPRRAGHAIEALSTLRFDEAVCARARECIAGRGHAELSAALERALVPSALR